MQSMKNTNLKINELESSMQKQQSTIAEQNEKQKEASNKWIESSGYHRRKDGKYLTKNVLDLRNRFVPIYRKIHSSL